MVIELETSSSGWRELAFAANCVIWAIFVAELAFILWVAPRKAAALKAHWLDEVIIVMTAPLFGRLANEQPAPFAASFRALAREPALQSPRPRPSASAFDSSIPAPDSVAYVSAVAQ